MPNQLSGLLGAAQDPQFRSDVVNGLLGAVNRGGVAGLLGSPVDLAAMAMRPLGYRDPNPVGGSEWIGQQMERMGMVPKQRNALAETIASFAVPMAGPIAGRGVYSLEQMLMPQSATMIPAR